jgi:hypothetical protein
VIMQAHESVRDVHGCERCLRVRVLEAIDVGAGKQHHDRPVGMRGCELTDGRSASPGMNRHQQISTKMLAGITVRFDLHPMAERAQNARPAHRRDSIATARLFCCRGDHGNVHLFHHK